MKRVLIIFLVFLVSAAFSKVQGDAFYHYRFFPLAQGLTEIWPGYLAKHCEYLGVVGMAWLIFDLERLYVREAINEVKVAAWLITGRWLDYFIEGNHGWFSVCNYPVSYDTLAFLVFAVVFVRSWEKLPYI